MSYPSFTIITIIRNRHFRQLKEENEGRKLSYSGWCGSIRLIRNNKDIHGSEQGKMAAAEGRNERLRDKVTHNGKVQE